jgi:HSP20 family protein
MCGDIMPGIIAGVRVVDVVHRLKRGVLVLGKGSKDALNVVVNEQSARASRAVPPLAKDSALHARRARPTCEMKPGKSDLVLTSCLHNSDDGAVYRGQIPAKDTTSDFEEVSMLTRWNPMQEIYNINRMFDTFWNSWNSRSLFWPDTFGVGPAMDLIETDDALVLQAELPGFNPEDIDIKVENGVLHLKGTQQAKEDTEQYQYHLRERGTWNFQRAFSLPVQVDADKAEAQFENGVLTLKLPKTQEALPKKIAIVPKKEITAQSQS